MRNLLDFIVRYSHLLLFLLLEAVAIWLITHYQSYSQATLFTSANQMVAGINEAGANTANYFQLSRQNEQLNEQICQLQTEVQQLRNRLEQYAEDSGWQDSIPYHYAHLGYRIIPAKVIDITTHQEHNFLTLNKGKRDGIKSGMGVICGESIVGVVSKVNEHFALVVPLIHTSINISARIKKNGEIGFTHWNGMQSHYVQLMEIGRHTSIEEGDTIITSGMTSTFPEGMMIGIADKVRLDDGDNYYDIRLRLSTDFGKLNYVQVLDNTMRNEIDSLHDE
ncbi:MAG: rod shape-determining protein MreC [Paludibacteraceae bacterium]|nr:rod shape-determining protein MreC [Paludibacteraceae bacterium]